MRLLYVELTADEAQQARVTEAIDKFCLGLSLNGAAIVKCIGNDNPSVGVATTQAALPEPFAAPVPSPAAVDTAAIFGNGAPSTAGAALPPTAPAAPMGTSPLPPTVNAPPAATSAPGAVAPTAAATATPAGAVELDADGLPWDGRIHSSKRSKTADGKWRALRGLNDAALVARVQAELRAGLAAPAAAAPVVPPAPIVSVPAPAPVAMPAAPVVQAQAPAPTPAPVVMPAAPVVAEAPAPVPPPILSMAAVQQVVDAAQASAAQAPAPAPAPVVPPTPPVAPAAPAEPTFAGLMARLSPHMSSGLLTEARQQTLFAKLGVPTLPALMTRPDLVKNLYETLDQWVSYWQAGGA